MTTPEGKALTAAAPANLALLPKDLTADLVVRFVNKHADAKEIMFFLQQCVALNLNPFTREIFLIKYSPTDIGQIVIAYSVFIARAERSLRLKGWRTWVDYQANDPEQKGDPVRAHIEIFRADWDKPFVHSVRFTEYIGYKGDGTITKMWKTKAETMIRKVVTAQGFRLCFPDELGDLPFTTEELGQDEPNHNAPSGPMPEIKAEAYVKPKAEVVELLEKVMPKAVVAEIIKPPQGQEAAPNRPSTPPEAEDPGPEAPIEPPVEAPKPAKPAPAKKPAPTAAAPAPAKTTPPAKPAEAKSGFAPTALKERILSLMAILEKDFGKDPAAMYQALMGRIQAIFKRTPEEFPDDLTALEAAKTVEILERTVRSEEDKKAAAPAAEETI